MGSTVLGDVARDSLVKVVVRCRPMSEKETKEGHSSIVESCQGGKIIIKNEKKNKDPVEHSNQVPSSYEYTFNETFGPPSTQKEIYDSVCKPLVESVLEGYNGTIFAYGQTGTGKTYTIEGATLNQSNTSRNTLPASSSSTVIPAKLQSDTLEEVAGHDKDERLGIMPRAFEQVFDYVASKKEIQFLIRASFLEIYREEIRDLLRKDQSIKLELHERPDSGTFVKNLSSYVCKSKSEIDRLMRIGRRNRTIAVTDMNERSSRSHAIFMITVEQQRKSPSASKETINRTGVESKGATQNELSRVIRVGKLNLVDLAGSERLRKTNSLGLRQKESIKINLSLSALGNVINSLMKLQTELKQTNHSVINNSSRKTQTNDSTNFVPYRDSKLTRLLQDSLGGNAKTLMIANIGPASCHYEETINTLNYASRAKFIRNRPRLNEDPKDALLRELQQEINELRVKLNGYNSSDTISNKQMPNGVDANQVESELLELRTKLGLLQSKLLNSNNDEPGKINEKSYSNVGEVDQYHLLQKYTREQEALLEKSREELLNQTNREQAIRDELDRRDEAKSMAEQSYSSMQHEVGSKRKLIRQILLKTQSIRNDIDSNQQAYRLDLDELDQLQFNLQKELKLKCLIMDNFIPNSHVDQVLSRVIFDERRNSCYLTPPELALEGCRYESQQDESDGLLRQRISTEFEKIGATIYTSSLRFKNENLIQSQLEFSDLTEPPTMKKDSSTDQVENSLDNRVISSSHLPTHIQKLLDDSLSQSEPDLVI